MPLRADRRSVVTIEFALVSSVFFLFGLMVIEIVLSSPPSRRSTIQVPGGAPDPVRQFHRQQLRRGVTSGVCGNGGSATGLTAVVLTQQPYACLRRATAPYRAHAPP